MLIKIDKTKETGSKKEQLVFKVEGNHQLNPTILLNVFNNDWRVEVVSSFADSSK